MSALEKTMRRNFIVVFVVHAVLITALFSLEKWAPDFSTPIVTAVDIVVPAAPLGELPGRPGHGTGAFTPPPAPPDVPRGNDTGAGTPTPRDETPAPPTPPTPTPTPVHDNIGIQPNKPPKQPVKPPKNSTPTKPGKPTNTNTGTAKGPTADQIRQRFLNALRNAGGTGTDGGTPSGDNRTAGGGSGRGRIGSPDGSPDGVPGGIGPGSPNWQYFLHVHDKMYEAWEQPGSINDHKLVAIITIKVARDGNIIGVTLKRSSGNKIMDNSALAAARRVQMLEPPPEALVKGSAAEISVDFQMEG